jgi:hypothetical protein
MSFDKFYPNRKDKRKAYYRNRAVDKSCRPHGGCPACQSTRNRKDKKSRQSRLGMLSSYEDI